MVFGKLLAKFYGKHTKGLKIENLKESLESTYHMIPDIQKRIEVLDSLEVDEQIETDCKEGLGKTMYKHLLIENNVDSLQQLNQLQLFHLITHYISHRVNIEMQARYQMRVSKLFNM